MNELTKFLIQELLDEQKTVAIYGGGFKPPTKGHFTVVEKALSDFPEIDEFKVFVGSGVRDGVTQEESIKVWDIYKNYLSPKVNIEPSVAPVKSILGYAKENPKTKIYWILGAREGNEEDVKDIINRTKTIDKYPNIEVKTITTTGGVSGTKTRDAIKSGNKELFYNSVPDIKEKDQIWNLVSPVIKEVGEASLAPYKWEEVDKDEYFYYVRFTTDNDVEYEVDLESILHVDRNANELEAFNVEFIAKPKGAEGYSDKIVVNKGEIYRVMSTIVDIIKYYAKKDKVQAILYSPAKKGNEDFGSQRDQLYKAFIKKALPGVYFEQKGDWIAAILPKTLNEADPKVGTGKKPKGSGRRLYTDEDPKDTVSIKFKTKEDIVDTLNKASFKAKSHVRQSQVINLIHQRVRAAYGRAKDPEVKSRLKRALDYIEKRKEMSKKKTERLRKMKEASDPQAGTALPYGSGFAPVKEIVTDTEVICDNCGWEWDIKDGGEDLYVCHKCGHDNEPKENSNKAWNLQEGMLSLSKYMIDNGMNIKPLPKIKVIKSDKQNASDLLGKTAFYNPNDKSITLYTMDRHPKDILRSFAHEMIHHEQNLNGKLENITTTNTNEGGDLPEIEREAYEKGNMMLRNWEDSIKNPINEWVIDIPKYNYTPKLPNKLFSQIYELKINEINLNPDNAVKVNGDLFGGDFKVGDIEYVFSIKNIQNPYNDLGLFYNIQFDEKYNDKSSNEPTGNAKENYIKILSTMYKIILDFAEKEKPKYIGISSLDKSGYRNIYNNLSKTNNIPNYLRKDAGLEFTSKSGDKGKFVVLKRKDV